jgi:septum formation topological specificity factor MinE
LYLAIPQRTYTEIFTEFIGKILLKKNRLRLLIFDQKQSCNCAMDTLDKYKKIIEDILTEYVKIPYAYGQLETKLIIDRTATNYIVMTLGWQDEERVHGCIIHIEIIDGKIWIQRDRTEYGIANELVAAGIPKDKIVLAFHPEDVRQYTEFAVA